MIMRGISRMMMKRSSSESMVLHNSMAAGEHFIPKTTSKATESLLPERKVVAESATVRLAVNEAMKTQTNPAVKVFAGIVGGIVEASVLQPLDVAKTRMQLDRTNKYSSTFSFLRRVPAEEGVKALYRGLTPVVTNLGAKYALRFGIYEQVRVAMNGGNTGASSNTVNFLAGTTVGCIEATMVVTPLELIKTRLQAQTGNKNLKYTGPVDVLQKVIKEEGVRALWSGNIPTVVRQGSNQAFNFMTMQFLNEIVWDKKPGDGKVLPAYQTFLNGLVAGAVGPCFNAPVDVVKVRMQAQKKTPGQAPKYTGWVQATKLIAQEEGVGALWKGLMPRLARAAPGQAIMWTVVMQVSALFEGGEVSLV